MTPAEDLADVRALVADVAAEAAQIATAIAEFKAHVDFAGLILDVHLSGYNAGRAEWDDKQADANAQKARGAFKLIIQPATPKGDN